VTARVGVIGGGLAGITAALRLADAGCEVTLFEAKPRLGGLTHSFRHGELDVDNGQHVFMRCCTAYRALLDRLGTAALTTLQPRLDVPVARATDGRRSRLRRDRLPAPLHLARSLARYSVLSPADRVRAVRGALAMRGVDRDEPRTDDRSFGEWLRAHGQSAATVEALWDLVGIATMNSYAADASLAIAATVFQIGLLTDGDAADIGWSLVPLQQLHGDAAQRALDVAGADVWSRSRVTDLVSTGGGWTVRTDDDLVEVDAVVVATDAATMDKLLPAGAVALPAGWSDALGAAPIVNLHLVYDRPVMDDAFVAGIGTPVQWVFDRTRQAGLATGQYLAVSLSAADNHIDVPVARLQEAFVPEVQRLLPATRTARLLDFFVTRERRATFRPSPGVNRLRPPTSTSYDGLFLAGAHCATGWPATMEGAVRSGYLAGECVLGSFGKPQRFLQPDLPLEGLSKKWANGREPSE
jgi:squalene-associated FAD-dependent desaturase